MPDSQRLRPYFACLVQYTAPPKTSNASPFHAASHRFAGCLHPARSEDPGAWCGAPGSSNRSDRGRLISKRNQRGRPVGRPFPLALFVRRTDGSPTKLCKFCACSIWRSPDGSCSGSVASSRSGPTQEPASGLGLKRNRARLQVDRGRMITLEPGGCPYPSDGDISVCVASYAVRAASRLEMRPSSLRACPVGKPNMPGR